MDGKVIREKKDLTHLVWSRYRRSSGTAGSLLKAYDDVNGTRVFYKLSAYDSIDGIFGHECVNEIIADRLLTLFGIDHVPYQLVHADVLIDDVIYDTYLCASDDFKRPGEKKIAFDVYYEKERLEKESPLMLCERMGCRNQIDAMLFIDYLILNRDRHGANIEVLKDPRTKTIRLAPLYDHGLSLLFSCRSKADVDSFNVLEDRRIQCFVGSSSSEENLKLIKSSPVKSGLCDEDKEYVFEGLDDAIPDYLKEKIWQMLMSRWERFTKLI